MLGTRASFSSDLNLLLQLIILTLLLISIKFAKEKTQISLKRHGRIMIVAVILNTISVFLIMGPSFTTNFGAVLDERSTIGFPLTLIHHSFGLIAEVLGVILVFKKFGNVRMWMRLTMTVWLITFALGFIFYFQYYII